MEDTRIWSEFQGRPEGTGRSGKKVPKMVVREKEDQGGCRERSAQNLTRKVFSIRDSKVNTHLCNRTVDRAFVLHPARLDLIPCHMAP